jgi:hypothetical protein
MSGHEGEWTCGKGVAANAVLPERIANLLTAIGAVLDNHTRSLDPKDPSGKREISAYRRIVDEHRAAAERLAALAGTMKAYHDLPMAAHDVAVLTDAASIDAMGAFVRTEEEMLALLRDRAVEHGAMLEQIKRAQRS